MSFRACIACGGTGLKSRPGPGQPPECVPCGGAGHVEEAEGRDGDSSEEPLPLPPPPPSARTTVQHSSDSNEFYTPDIFVEAARKLMGGIDCDPASCELAQQVVEAGVWYGPGSPYGEDGLVEDWSGRVFLNPPGGKVPKEYQGLGTKSLSTLFWARLAMDWLEGVVKEAVFVGFTLEILRTAQQFGTPEDDPIPEPLDFHFCVPASRIPFDTVNRPIKRGKKKGQLIDPERPEGVRVETSSPGHANVLVWLPPVEGVGEDRLRNARSEELLALFERQFAGFGACR